MGGISKENIVNGSGDFNDFLFNDGDGSIDSNNDDDSIERTYDVPGGYGVRYENEDIGNRPNVYKQYKNGGTSSDRLSYDKYWQAYNSRVDTAGINQYYVYFRPNISLVIGDKKLITEEC